MTLSPPFRSPEAVKRWAERIGVLAGVEKVDYNQDWIDALSTIIRSIELVAIGIGLILSAAAVTIIANTIRLTLFARRDEIAILRLIGATKTFIRIPYFLEGAVLGGWEAPAHCSCSRPCTNCFGIKCGRRDGCGP